MIIAHWILVYEVAIWGIISGKGYGVGFVWHQAISRGAADREEQNLN